jgi:hypothetical protein
MQKRRDITEVGLRLGRSRPWRARFFAGPDE